MGSANGAAGTGDVVRDTMREVAAQQGKTLPPLTDELPLTESGLDSLCIAIIVAQLEDRLGADPFSGDEPTAFPVTVGEFVAAYGRAGA